MTFKFDLLFEVEVPRPWHKGKERDRFHEALEQAVFAEEMGFDTIWFVEHHFLREFAHSSAPEVMIGALSQRTSRIRIGFGVTLLPGAVNHPIRVAERAAVADILTDGRLEMGTGRSSSPYQLRAFGADVSTTREQWEESIKLLPALWTEEDLSFQGRFWSWDDKITVLPRPVQSPHPPLWVASTQPATCALAGQKGIGLLLPALAPPDELRQRVTEYKTAVAQPLDQIGQFKNDQAALFTVAFCHDDDDTARRLGGSAGLWYLQTILRIYADDWSGQPVEAVPDAYKHHAQAHRDGRGANTGTALQLGLTDGPAAYESFIDSGAFCVGDPDQVVAKVEQYRAVGGDRLVGVMQLADLRHDDLMRSIELFGKHVIPRVRAAERNDGGAHQQIRPGAVRS